MKQHENTKSSEDKQMSKVYKKNQGLNIVYVSLGLLIAFLSIVNLLNNQLISPMYYKFISGNVDTTMAFLQNIKKLPEYQNILELNSNIYGSTIKEEIYKQENKQKETINKLEQQLLINPKIRDILYGLYRLYLAEGDKDTANEYLRRAKEVDPTLKIESSM